MKRLGRKGGRVGLIILSLGYIQWRTQEFCSGGGGFNKFS